jgi:succinate dehydrogenase / fumarate reductase, iron-sulfur subunit
MADKTVTLIISRQDGPEGKSYSEEFKIPYRPNMNVISALMEIQRNPQTASGKKVAPVCWESNCLEEVCGACSMVINGRARQACTALIDKLEQPIRLEPMRTFPIERDLIVNRNQMFDTLKRIKAWIPIDGTHDLGPGPRMNELERQMAYEYSKCMTCGVCLEACPNVNSGSPFIGPFAFPQVQLKNMHPTGEMNKDERLDSVMGEGGITECGNSQNCVQVCPKGIPITTAIALIDRASTVRGIKKFLEN